MDPILMNSIHIDMEILYQQVLDVTMLLLEQVEKYVPVDFLPTSSAGDVQERTHHGYARETVAAGAVSPQRAARRACPSLH